MATWAYPPLPAEQINREADTALVCKTYMDLTTGDLHMEACLPVAMIREGKWSLSSIMPTSLSWARELEWLLHSLQDSLASLKEGLQECAALLAPQEPGSTLVLSSLRSENVKGFVTRVGTKVVKGVWIPKLARISMYMQLN
mgnify:CR=1 FL=1